MKLFIYYILIINFISFLIMYIDKRKAIKKKWRISENTLIFISIIGGSIGMLIGMNFLDTRQNIKNLLLAFQ